MDGRRYERFGWDYRRWNPADERAVAWFQAHARETGGPVLELACGTGSLVGLLAREGHEVVGVDLSASMLRIAEDELQVLEPEVRSRVALVHGDMTNVDLGRKFALVILADNSLRELQSEREILACLRCVRRHLAAGGRFLAVARRFDPSAFESGARESPWSKPYPGPAPGTRVRRRTIVRLDEQTGQLQGAMIYEVTLPDGVREHTELPFRTPALVPEDVLRLFRDAGFEVRSSFDYDDPKGPREILCLVAE